MKLFGFLAVIAAFVTMTSCASLNQPSSATTNTSAAYTAGSTCGSALLALYKQYKADGKIDLSNSSNLLSLAALAGSSSNLKANLKNGEYYKGFANGTMSGSNNLVSNSNVSNVLSSLTGIDLSTFAKNATTKATESKTTETISSVVSILKLLKK